MPRLPASATQTATAWPTPSPISISPGERVFTEVEACLTAVKPDLVILCPATADHARFTEQVAPLAPGATILVEKPFAASLADADRMIAAAERHRCRLAINWPLAWYPPHVTTKRLIDDGVVGDVVEVHFYDGNRGPLFHRADKVVVSPEEVAREKLTSWWYQKASGGGSLLDYLGYGATLGTWYLDGEAPIEVTSVVDRPDGLEVDEHSITVLRYACGLSKMETRWGTFSDPWTLQPQPKCGFVIVGTKGTISSYDFEDHVTVQTADHPEPVAQPVDQLLAPHRAPVEYVLSCVSARHRNRWSAVAGHRPHRSAHRRYGGGIGAARPHLAFGGLNHAERRRLCPEIATRGGDRCSRSALHAVPGHGRRIRLRSWAPAAFPSRTSMPTETWRSTCAPFAKQMPPRRKRAAPSFFPNAQVIADYHDVLADPDIEIVDLTPHAEQRADMIRDCLIAGKHVLSQKPFVLDLAVGEELCDLADRVGRKLAVNQNGRWAPHFAYLREAVRRGLIGKVSSIRIALAWDHRWIRGTPFEAMHDIILFDFGIHWFDFVTSVMGRQPQTVRSLTTIADWTGIHPPMLVTTLLDYGDAQVSLSFDAANAYGPSDTTFIGGSEGSLYARGPDLGTQTVEYWTKDGVARPNLAGQWFNDGFAGTMAELMCAIEDDRTPLNKCPRQSRQPVTGALPPSNRRVAAKA